MLGNELLGGFDVLAAGAAQAARVPVVDDPVLRAVQQEDALLGRRVLVEPGEPGEHVPVARVDPARERPAPRDHVAVLHLARLRRREHERRGDQRIGRASPDLVLGARRKHAEHQMVRKEIDEIPRARGARAREQRAESDHRGELELGAADAARLVDPVELGVVEVAQRLVGNAAQLFAARRALLQPGEELARPSPQLVMAWRHSCTSRKSALRSTASRRGAAGCIRRASRDSRCGGARR